MPAEKLKLEMVQQKVEELFFLQTGVPSLLWEVIAGVPANARRCPAVPFNTAPALERSLSNISKT